MTVKTTMDNTSTQIILVRHGQTEWNRVERFRGRIDIALNATGLRQAEAAGEAIGRRYRPVAVYSSALSRAVKTAEPIAKIGGLQVQILDGILDCDFGDWQGLTSDEVKARWPVEHRLWFEEPEKGRVPGGETLEQVRARAVAAVETVAKRHEGQTIALVSHKVVCKVLMCTVLGLDNSHYWRIEQDNAAINVFVYRAGSYLVKLLNDTCHLEGVNGTSGK